MKALHSPRLISLLSLGLLTAGLVLDLATTRGLVVAIIYNVPIALSSLALSRRLTLTILGLAFGANIAAGYANSVAHGGLDAETVLNRSVAALSFLFVGLLTLLLRDAAARVARLEVEGLRSDRNEALRHVLSALGRTLYPEPLLQEAAEQFRTLLEADELVIAGLSGEVFAEPRYASPPNAASAQVGKSARWLTEALPLREPVTCLRQPSGLVAAARVKRSGAPDLIVIAKRPHAAAPKLLLSEAVESLEGLLLRADELERLAGRGEANAPS